MLCFLAGVLLVNLVPRGVRAMIRGSCDAAVGLHAGTGEAACYNRRCVVLQPAKMVLGSFGGAAMAQPGVRATLEPAAGFAAIGR